MSFCKKREKNIGEGASARGDKQNSRIVVAKVPEGDEKRVLEQ